MTPKRVAVQRRLLGDGGAATSELAGGTFAVADVVEYPSSRFRTNRWLVVADDLLGTDRRRSEDAGLGLVAELVLESRLRDTLDLIPRNARCR